ncbi:hypothetical protein FE257_006302 [Aspergillus nanangensis]|uniref:Shikimate dehydrogenase substrate binding N-terminal domain-containing protein n=1 Tax=Aspergillus nanangensis TaxID=2582783 RepID=A0AAD4GUW2_ASPNN|nr:hypothetical protein FE257_006302 [Aspergillus nanangensis]
MDILQQSYRYGKSPLTPGATATPYCARLYGGAISQSLSPLLHSILFKSAGTSWSFHLAQTTSGAEFMSKLKATDSIGASITMPNKVTFQALLDDLTDEARVIGAVNTAFIRLDNHGRRRYIGTNTDCVGIRETILQREPQARARAQGQPAMVVGGGGAARSAIYALWKWFQPSEIYIANRLKSEVDAMASYFQSAMPGIRLRHLETVESATNLPSPYLIVGTVPDYPPSEPGEVLCWKICEAILKDATKGVLVDMCYMPSPETNLILTARGNGWQTISGREVLVRVCTAQQVLWTEKEPNEQGIKAALLAIEETSRDVKL